MRPSQSFQLGECRKRALSVDLILQPDLKSNTASTQSARAAEHSAGCYRHQEYFKGKTMTDHDSKFAIAAHADADRKSGRVVFDNDGRSVWEWQTATGVFTRDVTAAQLTSLSAVELAIEQSQHEIEHEKIFSSAKPIVSSQRSQSKKQTRSVSAWLKRGWLG